MSPESDVTTDPAGIVQNAPGAAVAALPEPRLRKAGGHRRWVGRRILLGLATVFVAATVVFLATQALPGNAAQAILGQRATPQRVAALQSELGLNHSLGHQYLTWLGNAATLDFGRSLDSQLPVRSLIGAPLVNSLILVALVALVALPLSIFVGSLAAIRRDGILDGVGVVLSLVFNALPEFVVGLVLILCFGTTLLTILPPVAFIPAGSSPLSHLDELILPVATLTLATVPYLFRLVRGSMIDVLDSEYVQMARLKGVPTRRIVRRHALPNALIPMVQGSALILTYLLGGIVVVEFLFGYPGLGSLLERAISQRDVPTIQAVTLVFATEVVIVNLLADFLTVYLTPRLRTAGA